MRLLVVLRGLPGVGKSTFINQHDLANYVISPDEYRVRLGALVLNECGQYYLSNKLDKQVWEAVMLDIENRMKELQTTFVDATHTKESYFNQYKKLCDKHRYRMVIIEFNKDIETVKRQNANRSPAWKRVPEDVIDRMAQQMENPLSEKFQKMVCSPEQFWELYQFPIINDLNKYKEVVVIGDIHGCHTALIKGLKRAEAINNDLTLMDDKFYIFLGDYIDRGIENEDVINFIYSIKDRDNVKLLEGNHESHIQKLNREHGWDEPQFHIPCAKETVRTVMGLTADGKKRLSSIANKLGLVYVFEFDGRKYQCTHAPMPALVNNIAFSGKMLLRGVGLNPYPMGQTTDENFSKYAQTLENGELYSIHGHANVDVENIDIHNTSNTFNLCDEVEHGGNLRILVLKKE